MAFMLDKIKRIHFVGIGGIGMSSIAQILHAQGLLISGSDQKKTNITSLLEDKGMKIFEGHKAEHIKGADAVVFSSAVSADNPEVKAAIEAKLPTIKRSEMLAECMRLKYGIGIAGTHGKTTTTAMVGMVLAEEGYDPAVIVGGTVKTFGGFNARPGKGEYVVVEADEYDRTFLQLNPVVAVLTTLETDHLDTYESFEDLRNAFIEYANKVPFYGFSVVCIDDDNLWDILPELNHRTVTYGLAPDADVTAVDIKRSYFQTTFTVKYCEETAGEITLNQPGLYNVQNALAAVAVGLELGVSFAAVKRALESFTGVDRRFQVKYDKEIMVVDDYAHHPTEVEQTLEGVRGAWQRRIIAVFQPHLFSRTKEFAEDFGKAFMNADLLLCTDIYPAREMPIEGVTGELIVEAARRFGHTNATFVKEKDEIPEVLKSLVEDGDIIITMGAGDIFQQGEKFVTLIEGG